MTLSIHTYGYEGKVEEVVPVEEFHRAHCELCDWQSEEFDAMGWKEAEQAAIDHYDVCPERDDEDEDEDEDDG